MIRSKKRLYIAIALLISAIILIFPFPHDAPYGETIFTFFNIPVRFGGGVHTVGIFTLFLFITGLFFLACSLKNYQGRFIVLAILVVTFLPPYVTDAYQKSLASGIYAISYNQEESNCSYERTTRTIMYAECTLPFENKGEEDVRFSIEFEEYRHFEGDFRSISLLNESGPHEVKLRGKERRQIKIETYIDISNIEEAVESGTSTSVDITIQHNKNNRRL